MSIRQAKFKKIVWKYLDQISAASRANGPVHDDSIEDGVAGQGRAGATMTGVVVLWWCRHVLLHAVCRGSVQD